MKVPIAWLRDYLDLDVPTADLVARLAQLGFPVEGVEARPQVTGVVVGRLVKVEKHPNADRLQVCTVDVGTRTLVIATAAGNVAQDQIVPVATIGALLVSADGKPLRIERRTMRGIESQGMLCSAFEFGFEADWFEDGILQLDPDAPIGADAVAYLRLADDVLDVEITANRSDMFSILGVARELAAGYGRSVREPAVRLQTVAVGAGCDAASSDLRVTLESPDCRRFVAQRFSNVDVRPAPTWMRIRLALAGQRPINNLVDISNFVMLEIGKPMHFYDYDKLAGHRLIARDGRDGEVLRTLDGTEHRLDARALVIADEREPNGLAGVMGGAASEVTAATHELALETAVFSGPRIRRMSLAWGIRTDASARNEKNVPLGLPDVAAARAAYLLEHEGARVLEPFAAGLAVPPPTPIVVPDRRISGLLGVSVSRDDVERALGRLGFTVAVPGAHGETAYTVTPPAWRTDVAIPEDVIEEIARIVGYDRIDAAQAPVIEQSVDSSAYERERRVAHALAATGYRETITYALQPAGVRERFERAGIALASSSVEILNPLSEDQRFMRFSLLPGLLNLVARHQALGTLRLFEIGHVFAAGADADTETAEYAWMLALPRAAEPVEWRDDGFLIFKGEAEALFRAIAGSPPTVTRARWIALHPGKTASLLFADRPVATIGAIDPRLCAAYAIDLAVYAGIGRLEDLPPYRVPQYRAPSRYPALDRDLAVVVDPQVSAAAIEAAVRAGGDGAIREVQIFDEYRGSQVGTGRKSVAVRILFGRNDATLTDGEAEAYVERILTVLRERLAATIRQ